jgi:hypothetical protein
MSLSSDFAAAKHKSSHLLNDISEAHPVVTSLVFMGGLVTAIMMLTRLFMS